MAIIIEGMECRICNKKMSQNEIISFPPFISNSNDPLYFFNDSAFHMKCFQNHDMSSQVIDVMNYIKTILKNKTCDVCSNIITNPDDFFGLGLLVRNKSDVLFDYNFFQCHNKCLNIWEKRDFVINEIKRNINNWDEHFIKIILDNLTSR